MTRETRKQCRVCGANKPLREYYKKPDNRDNHANICMVCEREERKARRENSETYSDSNNDSRRFKFGGPWLIINDPDDTWGRNSSLTLQALRKLIDLEYVCVGLKLRHKKTGRVAKIVRRNGSLVMRYERSEVAV